MQITNHNNKLSRGNLANPKLLHCGPDATFCPARGGAFFVLDFRKVSRDLHKSRKTPAPNSVKRAATTFYKTPVFVSIFLDKGYENLITWS